MLRSLMSLPINELNGVNSCNIGCGALETSAEAETRISPTKIYQ
jgi:hypothetical protein